MKQLVGFVFNTFSLNFLISCLKLKNTQSFIYVSNISMKNALTSKMSSFSYK